MWFNKFGCGSNKSIKYDLTKAYVDKKFINLASSLAIKASKSGESFSGNIDMGPNKFTSSSIAAKGLEQK